MATKSNKTIVAGFYKHVIGQRNEALIDTYVSGNYIQHSPSGKDGREGLREMICFLKTLPSSTEQKSPVKLLLADGNLVAGLLHISFMGKQRFVVDLFRIQDGQLAEHWDAVADTTRGDFDGIMIDPTADAKINKQIVQAKYKLESRKIHRIIAEGDVVIVQLEVVENGIQFVRYDILRGIGAEIEKVLSIQQQIPDVMTHNNGML
ncbi:hypothetical protein ACFS5N_02520 [Mucilaginibacter ximonensis]|uniref:SnoaL-like aldol condensation-catalyzing enzyme n=1 Tax=Mucilaginibacter ximonensis TaxID=538021 RepID=A0ABW5Y8G9_9SPHI